jgi:hypothetical protein
VANAGVRGRPIEPLVLSALERTYLERQVRRHHVARSLSERCRAILRCADGLPSKSVAAELGIHEHTVGKWRRRFLKDRCDGLLDEARPGRLRTINDDQVAAVRGNDVGRGFVGRDILGSSEKPCVGLVRESLFAITSCGRIRSKAEYDKRPLVAQSGR